MDRFQVVMGHYVFCVLYHTGQGCPLYARLSRILRYFSPPRGFSEHRFLEDEGGDEWAGAYEVFRRREAELKSVIDD